ncbi:7TM GPCR domain containing protein [Aphelenchoides besseyi]|nr:7TM GPCR domain containing protein [Aphelenchoides besseyi]
MNAALGRNPLLSQTESPPRIQEELIDINEALGPVYKKPRHFQEVKTAFEGRVRDSVSQPTSRIANNSQLQLIKARFRAMNRVNSSWPPNVAVEPIYTHEDQVFHFTDDQPELRAMVAHQATTILFTIFGNLLMIFVILRNNYILRRKRITPADLLMLHMCTSDLLFACITIFPTLMITLTVPQFHGPDILCKFVKFLQVLPMYSSSFLLVAISADRFYVILYAAIAWISAFCCSTPQFFIFGKNLHDDCTGQYSASWQYPTYVIVFNVVVWLLPSTIAGCLYFCVCRAVWRSMAFEKSCGTPSRGSSGKLMGRSASTAGQEEEHQHLTACTSDGQRRQSRLSSANTLVHHSGLRIQREELDRKRIQTVKLTLTIVAANFILWAPFCIISVIDALMPSFLSPVFATYVMFFGNLNSSCNPIIYFVLNKEAVCTALRPLFDRKTTRIQSDCSTAPDQPPQGTLTTAVQQSHANQQSAMRASKDRQTVIRSFRSRTTSAPTTVHLPPNNSTINHQMAASTISTDFTTISSTTPSNRPTPTDSTSAISIITEEPPVKRKTGVSTVY